MYFGINCVSHSALDDKSAERMANQNRILPAASVKFACCFRNCSNRVVTIKITGQSFSSSLSAIERQLAYNRNHRQFSAPSEIHPNDMKSIATDELRLTERRQPFAKPADVGGASVIVPPMHIGDNERPAGVLD